MLQVFTIGHSNHPFPTFAALLSQHGVKWLADIRRFPGSRTHPHFNRDRFEVELQDLAFGYTWLEELGGRRSKSLDADHSPNGGLRNSSFRNYADYMLTGEFEEGMRKLIDLARERSTAMMCAEGLWWRCHRRLVSDWLVSHDVHVEHIFPNGVAKPHVMTAGGIAEAGHVVYPADPSLFDRVEGLAP